MLLCLFLSKISAQVVGNISMLADNTTFLVSIIPNKTLERPYNITNTGQITLKAPAGSFEVSTLKSLTGIWQLNTIIQQPVEAPNLDYLVFNLVTHIPNPVYQANIEVPLFSFKNKNGCLASIELIENFADVFWPPNSLDVNIGNQLTILEYGINNAYEKNNPLHTKIICPSILKVDLLVDSVKCFGDQAALKIQLDNGTLPFYYELNSIDGLVKKDSILLKGDSALILLPAGTYQFLGFDKVDSLQQNIQITAPNPLEIEVLQKSDILCSKENSASIKVKGNDGTANNNFDYRWSNGAMGSELTNLKAGQYTVTLLDKNNCSTTKAIVIATIPSPAIDSLEMYLPTCHNADDGLIEIIQIKAGTPPFKYALDKGNYQNDNYFDNLSSNTYQINVSDANNCVTSKRVTLENPPKLTFLDTKMDTALLIGQSVKLMPLLTESANLFYNWTPETFLSCSDCPNPIATPRQTITYTLVASNHLGCETSLTSQINIFQHPPVFAPNAFSPNNDGENDSFEVFTGPTIAYGQQLQIFNRWGQLVFDMKNNTPHRRLSWDGYIQGKLADSGVYIYVAKLQLENGTVEIQKGDFFLLK